jgi:hypothetical protein
VIVSTLVSPVTKSGAIPDASVPGGSDSESDRESLYELSTKRRSICMQSTPSTWSWYLRSYRIVSMSTYQRRVLIEPTAGNSPWSHQCMYVLSWFVTRKSMDEGNTTDLPKPKCISPVASWLMLYKQCSITTNILSEFNKVTSIVLG